MSKTFLKNRFFCVLCTGPEGKCKNGVNSKYFFIHLIISWRKFSCQENNGDLRENRKRSKIMKKVFGRRMKHGSN